MSSLHTAPAGDAQRRAVSRPELSIIVVTYACRALVLDCLASLERQRGDVAFECLLVDNASDDGTLEAVRESHPWVDARPAGGNVGFSRANNLAMAHAKGRTLLLLNPDTVVPDGALRSCLNALEEHPDVGVLGCKLVQPTGDLDHACKRGFPTPENALWYFLGLHRLRPRSKRFAAYTAGHIDADEVSAVDAVNGAFMLVRAEAFEVVGGLDEGYWMYGEDLDWCLRFWRAGWKVLYWPGAEVIHVKGGSATKSRAWRSNYAFHAAMWRFYRTHYAPDRSLAVTATVSLGIHVKFLISALRSAARRRMSA